jgi:hypothetical protein
MKTLLAALLATPLVLAAADAAKPGLGYQNTPLIPGTKWHVHDGERPQPPLVTPGTFSTQEKAGTPPSDAIVLFDGKDLTKWKGPKGEPGWKVENGEIVIVKGGGTLTTKEEFGDIQLHLEFTAPTPPKGNGQGRSNSGLFFMGRYEFQILDSHNNPTYPDGQATALYGQVPPQVNASRAPGEWQTYDVVFTAPRFNEDGTVKSPGTVTALHNGVVVHNHSAYIGGSTHQRLAKYSKHGLTGPISLQDHGDPVRFRNIWVRPIKTGEEQAK